MDSEHILYKLLTIRIIKEILLNKDYNAYIRAIEIKLEIILTNSLLIRREDLEECINSFNVENIDKYDKIIALNKLDIFNECISDILEFKDSDYIRSFKYDIITKFRKNKMKKIIYSNQDINT